MTIVQFQYVLAVAKYKNFSLAAEKCFVTQPTLSMQVQKLEEELGVLIFDRSRKPLAITEIGEKIIAQAQNIVIESQRIGDIIHEYKNFIGGEFRLAIIPTAAPTILPLFLNTFIKKYPKVELKIEELSTNEIVKGLVEGTLDAGIAATPLKEDSIIEKALYYEPFVAYIPDNHPLSHKKEIEITDIRTDNMLMLEDGHCFSESVLNICSSVKNKKNKENFEIKSGSFETLINLANEGLGMTLLPYLHSRNIAQNHGKVHHFTEPSPAREISLIYHTNKLKISVINALYELITGVVRGVIAFENVKIISPKPQYKR